MIASLDDALLVVRAESYRRHQQLLRKRADGELLYEPYDTTLYVWELKVRRQIVGMGHRSTHEYTRLYVRQDLAIEGAGRILAEAEVGKFDDTVQELIAAEKWAELVAYVTTRYSQFEFEITPEPVLSNPKIQPITDPPMVRKKDGERA